MAARGVDFSLPGNQTILTQIGANLGLTTSSTTSNAVVILSEVTYVDNATCILGGCPADASGNAIGCTNKDKWVFARRLVIGRPSVRTSNLGSPLVGGPDGVTMGSDGRIAVAQYVKKTGAVAQFTGINPYQKAEDNTVSGLPSGQVVYVSEASAMGFSLRPFTTDLRPYSYGMF
jgi:hypothetical protein